MKLIINAEDFGLSQSINKGICEGLKEGFLTSASIFMNAKFTDEALKMVKENNFKNVGIHLNLTYGFPLTNPKHIKSLVEPDGKFRYMCSMPFFANYKDSKLELEAQIKKFLERGIKPSHLDFHHYFYSSKAVYEAFLELAKKYNLPVRSMTQKTKDLASEKGLKTTDYFIEEFHNSYFHSPQDLAQLSGFLKNKKGSCELMTTPGYVDDYTMTQTNYLQRETELNSLKEAFENGTWKDIELISFQNL